MFNYSVEIRLLQSEDFLVQIRRVTASLATTVNRTISIIDIDFPFGYVSKVFVQTERRKRKMRRDTDKVDGKKNPLFAVN